jgi:hypothetical protein
LHTSLINVNPEGLPKKVEGRQNYANNLPDRLTLTVRRPEKFRQELLAVFAEESGDRVVL